MHPLIPAFRKDDDFIAEVRHCRAKHEHFYLWWLGQSGFLVQWQGYHLLLDPYLSDSLTAKYADTDKPHIRMSERVVAPERLDFIDVVTSSHNHTDHLDAFTLQPLMQVNPNLQLVIPEANRAFVIDRLQCRQAFPVGLNDGQSLTLGPFAFFGIPAAHNQLDRDETGQCRYMGYVIKFGPYTVYHSGDTLWHEEIVQALSPFSIDLALLPINGNKPERRVAGNLSAAEAAQFTKTIGARWVIPCHYHMFTFNTEEPDVFRREAEQAGITYSILGAGETWCSEKLEK